MLPLVIVAALTVKAIMNAYARSEADRSPLTNRSNSKPEKVIALVGAASCGKSSTGNALLRRPVFAVGPEHGTTKEPQAFPFANSYTLRDYPGLLDSNSASLAVNRLCDAELVIYVCAGQLFRQEIDFLTQLREMQANHDILSSGQTRKTVVFCNKRDIARATRSNRDLLMEEQLLTHQVAAIVAPGSLFFGYAGSTPDEQSNVSTLRDFIFSTVVK